MYISIYIANYTYLLFYEVGIAVLLLYYSVCREISTAQESYGRQGRLNCPQLYVVGDGLDEPGKEDQQALF